MLNSNFYVKYKLKEGGRWQPKKEFMDNGVTSMTIATTGGEKEGWSSETTSRVQAEQTPGMWETCFKLRFFWERERESTQQVWSSLFALFVFLCIC